MYEQLEANPPSPKFHAIFETVGGTDVELYTHSEKYLAPGGKFITVGLHPHGGLQGFARAARYALEVNRPVILGGTKRAWK